MPGKIKVKVLSGRNLPVMDRAGETTDAFVEIKFGGVTHKTDVCRKSLNPHWSSTEWYRFEVDESELQDEPLQLRLMDHDTYSANDAIGKVVISLAPLLAREASNVKGLATTPGGTVMSGWIPVFDTMHGIRGELNVIVKVELFSDFNKYKTSSCGVQFFHCPTIPPGYKAVTIHGFVEELVVNDDPEYQWIDKIRTPRASNEARQVAFIKLSNQVQRLVGRKAAELGANAVVGYQQDFDLEGEAGVVARAIGTAVSIKPLPMPCQPLSIPPCTQQQLKKYLDILATDTESITDLNQYFQNHQDELQKFLNILNPKTPALLDEPENVDEDEKTLNLTRQSSIQSYTGSLSIYQDDYISQKSLRHITEDQTDLNKLLRRNEDSDSDSNGPLNKIKKIKTNLFTKRFGSVRSRASEKQDDQISLKSNSSDTSRISLTEIKNEFKKFKRLKKPKFRKVCPNKEDEGIGMASILARSVIHAHTSLACIAETQDSEHSPNSTMRRTSESEPTINMPDEKKAGIATTDDTDKEKLQSDIKNKVSDTATSFKQFYDEPDVQEQQRKISSSCPTTPMAKRNINFLKPDYFGSLSLSGDSSEVYSSSEEEDESSDQKTDTEKAVETTSSVVDSVLHNNTNPKFIDQMASSIVECPKEVICPEDRNSNINIQFSCSSEDKSNSSNVEQKIDTITTQYPEIFITKKHSSNHNFKFHNPFSHKKVSKCVSAPSSPVEKSSFVYRSSKRIKNQISKLSKSSMIKSLSHYSLLPKKKHAKASLSQPGSTSDVPSKAPSHETVLGSPFFSYADLLSLDREGCDIKTISKNNELEPSKVTMYIGSEPVSRASISGPPHHYKEDSYDCEQKHHCRTEKNSLKPTGLIHTAMETILIDKVESLLVPSSTEPTQSIEQQFFNSVNEKLQKVEEVKNKSTERLSDIHLKSSPLKDSIKERHKKDGLVQTAIETILMDKIQSLLIPTTPEPIQEDNFFSYNINKNVKMNDKEEQEIKADYDNVSIQTKSMPHDKKESLVHTAVKTILIDKLQSLVPTNSALFTHEVENNDKRLNNQIKPKEFKEDLENSLLRTAMETILLDRAKSLMPSLSEKDDNENKESVFNIGQSTEILSCPDKNRELFMQSAENNSPPSLAHSHVPHTSDCHSANLCTSESNKQDNLLQSAIKTILLDKAQTLISTSSEISYPVNVDNIGNINPCNKTNYNKSNRNSLPETDIQTSLLLTNTEKMQNVENISEISIFEENKRKSQDNLVQTAIKTILLEKAQTLAPVHTEINSEQNENITKLSPNKPHNDGNKNNGLFQSAMEAILLDKVQILVPTPSEVDCSVPETDITDNFLQPPVDIHSSVFSSTVSHVQEITSHNPVEADLEDSLALKEKKDKKLLRQDSIHSVSEENIESLKMSREVDTNVFVPCKVTQNKPFLHHFHPILSGPPLETIPSLPENSFDNTESLDIEGIESTSDCLSECDSETNSVSVCDNSHAACRVNRSEREGDITEKDKDSPHHTRHESYGGREPVPTILTQTSSLNSSSTPVAMYRRSSDSDLSVTPRGGSLNTSNGNGGSASGAILRPTINANTLEMLEYPFLTMAEYPPEFVTHLGGTVCARSVKLIDAGGESAVRAAWWAELRTELRAHARALRCNSVIAYCEKAAICEDVCVLSASGTAAVINLDCDFGSDNDTSGSKSPINEMEPELCTLAHVPYSPGTGPYRAELSICGGCKKARVPAVLLATCAKPSALPACSKAVALTAVSARLRRSPPGAEPGARDISDQLPFLEYELHKLLLAKLRMQGANAIFSLQTQIAIGERFVMALASGTAVKLMTLPPPTPPQVKMSENDQNALDIQKALLESFNINRTLNGFDVGVVDQPTTSTTEIVEPEGEEPPVLDLGEDKEACVLELDEAEDIETAKSLAVRRVNMQVFTNDLKTMPAAPPQAFAQIWRARLVLSGQGGVSTAAEKHVARALDGVTYKLRRLQPCALAGPQFQIELPEDEIQLVVSGAAIPLADPNASEPQSTDNSFRENMGQSPNSSQSSHLSHGNGGNGDTDDDIFTLDEEQVAKLSPTEANDDKSLIVAGPAPTAVSLTSLSYLSGSKVVKRICALRLLFVRETTAVRELGGLSGFLHTFTCEVLAIVRAYTAALGGNALTSLYVTQLMLQDNAHKNQGQCLLSVGGDVVHITY